MLPRVFICYSRLSPVEFKKKSDSHKILAEYFEQNAQKLKVKNYSFDAQSDVIRKTFTGEITVENNRVVLSALNEIQYQVTRFMLDDKPHLHLADKVCREKTRLPDIANVGTIFWCVAKIIEQMPDCPIPRVERNILIRSLQERFVFDELVNFPKCEFKASDFKIEPESAIKLLNPDFNNIKGDWEEWTGLYNPEIIEKICNLYKSKEERFLIFDAIKTAWEERENAVEERLLTGWHEEPSLAEADDFQRLSEKLEINIEEETAESIVPPTQEELDKLKAEIQRLTEENFLLRTQVDMVPVQGQFKIADQKKTEVAKVLWALNKMKVFVRADGKGHNQDALVKALVGFLGDKIDNLSQLLSYAKKNTDFCATFREMLKIAEDYEKK